MSNRQFPVDCPADCPHHVFWDLSVDDITHYCDVLKMQVDDYDCGFRAFLPLCTLSKEEEKEIPMKPKEQWTDALHYPAVESYNCPSCHAVLSFGQDSCHECGQKLNWKSSGQKRTSII